MPRILTITDSLSERAGGLSHATLNLAISTANHWPTSQFFILSQYDGDNSIARNKVPRNLSIYTIPCFRNSIFPWSRGLYHAIDELSPDLVHLRGLWRQPSLACLKWKNNNPSKPLIVQTAGMLEPWARSRNRLLKRFYFKYVEQKLLDQCNLIHATSQQELSTLSNLGLGSKQFLVEEGIFLPSAEQLRQPLASSRPRKLLFLSRLHPVKGLDLLLESLALLRPRGWICVIAGMGESSYVAHLKQQVSRLNLDNIVSFTGALSGQEKINAFADADAFILPSYSESFGIAIAEAMSWGLPVITTTSTPWQVIMDRNMGWFVEPTVNDLASILFNVFYSPQDKLLDMGRRGRQYIAEHYDWDVISFKMTSIYRSLLEQA